MPSDVRPEQVIKTLKKTVIASSNSVGAIGNSEKTIELL
jgi:hypothetical protein